jgi:hypothetical protein
MDSETVQNGSFPNLPVICAAELWSELVIIDKAPNSSQQKGTTSKRKEQ